MSRMERQISQQASQQRRRRIKQTRRRAAQGQRGYPPASLTLCPSLRLASPSHCKWTIRPTLLLCRPSAALRSNRPDRATRWDTLTLASAVMQDFQLPALAPRLQKFNSSADTHADARRGRKRSFVHQRMRAHSPAHSKTS